MRIQEITKFHLQRVTVTYIDYDLIEGDLQSIGNRTATGNAFWSDNRGYLMVDGQHLVPDDIVSIEAVDDES